MDQRVHVIKDGPPIAGCFARAPHIPQGGPLQPLKNP